MSAPGPRNHLATVPPPRRDRRAAVSAGLAVFGTIVLTSAVSHWIAIGVYQSAAARTLAVIRQGAPEPRVEPGAIQGRIVIPHVGVDAVIVEGADTDVLDRAVGHVPGTAPVGAGGNVVLAGHRDTLFRGLRNIARGDTIEIQGTAQNRSYRVESIEVVDSDEVGVMSPTRTDVLTLITCYPFHWVGPAPRRFIVRAVGIVSDREMARARPPSERRSTGTRGGSA